MIPSLIKMLDIVSLDYKKDCKIMMIIKSFDIDDNNECSVCECSLKISQSYICIAFVKELIVDDGEIYPCIECCRYMKTHKVNE